MLIIKTNFYQIKISVFRFNNCKMIYYTWQDIRPLKRLFNRTTLSECYPIKQITCGR